MKKKKRKNVTTDASSTGKQHGPLSTAEVAEDQQSREEDEETR